VNRDYPPDRDWIIWRGHAETEETVVLLVSPAKPNLAMHERLEVPDKTGAFT
jgi:hypothetical protein